MMRRFAGDDDGEGQVSYEQLVKMTMANLFQNHEHVAHCVPYLDFRQLAAFDHHVRHRERGHLS